MHYLSPPNTAGNIIEHFKTEFETADELVLKAFAEIASDTRSDGYGRQVFQFLVDTLRSSTEKRQRAGYALSLTNLQTAAAALFNYYQYPSIRSSLLRMGDIAVPQLEKHLDSTTLDDSSHFQIINDLHAIGTPRASIVLASELSQTSLSAATQASWSLANLLRNPLVESELSKIELSDDFPTHEDYLYIWQPFDSDNKNMQGLISRIAYLIDQSDSTNIPEGTKIDPRIGIPLWAMGKTRKDIKDKYKVTNLESIQDQTISSRMSFNILYEDINQIGIEIHHGFPDIELFKLLDKKTQISLVRGFETSERPVTQRDWLNIFNPDEFIFIESWNHNFVSTVYIILSSISIILIGYFIWTSPTWITWHNLALVLASIGIVFMTISQFIFIIDGTKGLDDPEMVAYLSLGPISSSYRFLEEMKDQGYENNRPLIAAFALAGLIGSWVPIISILFAVLLSFWLPPLISLGIALSIWMICELLTILARRREFRAKNPLKGVLDEYQPRVSSKKQGLFGRFR